MSRSTHDRVSVLGARAAAECACEGLRRAARSTSRLYEAAFAPFRLTATQFTILVAVSRQGPIPLSRPAQGLVLDRTSLYRAVKPLVGRGCLRVGPGRTRRERSATLTESGRRLLAGALPAWETVQQQFVETLGPRTCTAFQSVLAQVMPVARVVESSARPASSLRRLAASR